MPASLDAQNAKPVLGVVERNAFDEARQDVLGPGLRLRL
jgi:hypothetical protein